MHEWVQKKEIQTWLYNHGQSHSQQALIKYGGSWTLRKCWKKPGSTEMIKSYWKAINTIMRSLTAKEIQEAKALAKEWNEWQPPWDVQSETTEKKGCKYAEEFAKEMWKQCGARVVVMAAWEDADGEILTNLSRHDFNDELGNGKLFEELDKCQNIFIKYAQMAFGNGGTDAKSPDKDATPWSRQRKSNGKPKTILPFLPPEVPFKELSQLTQDKLTAILEWWQEQKEGHPNNIFGFKKWRDAGGSLQMLVAVADSSGVRMGVKQDLDGSPDHLAGKRTMDRMMQWVLPFENKVQTLVMGNHLGKHCCIHVHLTKHLWCVTAGQEEAVTANRNDGTGTSMVDEDATEAVPLLDSQWQIARCQVAEGDTCQPIAIGKEPPNAWQQVVGSNTSPVQPMPEGCCIDSPDSLCPADPLAVPTTIKRGHKQEDSKCKLPIPSMIPMHWTGIDNARGAEGTKVAQ
ncbi:hypothetical protein F5J12DRAFT_785009 [Pisolithus orientalis]|uniref:uncharacterized protein n=1 Tax=Pisolithus orientalis TaxID=936130 RepID=UPI0022256D07|nr:uncharacterized protein F5J12DRAFT_785009 [Pisolithus orientalis]KAI5997777.1 hypothetical protein F5J12DRAFT_785009 [Pisolithus orientalis]